MDAPVVDMHVHLFNYDYVRKAALDWMKQFISEFDSFSSRMSSPQELERYLDESGVDYAVVLAEASPVTTGVLRNEVVAEFCAGSKRLIPFANINPYMVNNPSKELERCVKELGMKGLKLYPTYQYYYANDAMLYPIYAKALELGIPVMIHTGSSIFNGARLKYGDPLYVDDVAVDFPELSLILVHGGRGFWYDRAYFLARLHPNVYLEISGLPPSNLLRYFPELERISDKVLFGSDFPGMPFIKRNVEEIRRLPISETAKQNILGGNALRILKLDRMVRSEK